MYNWLTAEFEKLMIKHTFSEEYSFYSWVVQDMKIHASSKRNMVYLLHWLVHEADWTDTFL